MRDRRGYFFYTSVQPFLCRWLCSCISDRDRGRQVIRYVLWQSHWLNNYICVFDINKWIWKLIVKNLYNRIIDYLQEVSSAWILYQMYCDAYAVIWMTILFVCVLFEIRSGFIPLHWVLFPAIGNIVRHYFFNKWKGKYNFSIILIIFQVLILVISITFPVNTVCCSDITYNKWMRARNNKLYNKLSIYMI